MKALRAIGSDVLATAFTPPEPPSQTGHSSPSIAHQHHSHQQDSRHQNRAAIAITNRAFIDIYFLSSTGCHGSKGRFVIQYQHQQQQQHSRYQHSPSHPGLHPSPLHLKTRFGPIQTPHNDILHKTNRNVNSNVNSNFTFFYHFFLISPVDARSFIDYNKIMNSLFLARNII